MSSSAKNTSDISGSKCWPEWTMISATSSLARMARLTAAALMNCGRAPTTVRTRTRSRGISLDPRPRIGPDLRDVARVVQHAGEDALAVLAGPGDGALEPEPERRLRLEAELVAGLGRIAEASARAVPGPRRRQGQRHRVAGEAVDRGREVENRGLGARGQIIDLAGLAPERAGDQAPRDVLDEDEVAACRAAVLDRERLAVNRPPHAGRRD